MDREDVQTVSSRGSKSRNKVSVGEPAEGSLPMSSVYPNGEKEARWYPLLYLESASRESCHLLGLVPSMGFVSSTRETDGLRYAWWMPRFPPCEYMAMIPGLL